MATSYRFGFAITPAIRTSYSWHRLPVKQTV